MRSSINRYSISAVVFAGALASFTVAGVPAYETFEIQARANSSANAAFGTYNLPFDSFFTNVTPAINDHAEVSFQLITVAGVGEDKGIWFGAGGDGEIVVMPETDSLVSDTSINNDSFITFPVTFSSMNGVHYYDANLDESNFLTNAPLGNTAWTAAQVNNNGEVAFRGSFFGAGRIYYSWGPDEEFMHAAESGVQPGSPYDFLFTPAFNNNRQIAGKVLLVAGGNEIRIFETDGSSTLIAQDTGVDPNSPYTSFNNSVSLNDLGQVAFIAQTSSGNRGVFVSDGVTTVEIASEADALVSDIEFFSPTMNNDGLVAFRAFDGAGLRAIFVGDGDELVRVIGQFDEIETDLGTGQIAMPDTSPVFGGSVRINNSGDIAFNCRLTDPDDTSIVWGSAIYVAYAETDVPGDVNGDGLVNVDDLLIVLNNWGPCLDPDDCPADLTGDGQVNVDDLLMVLNNWTG